MVRRLTGIVGISFLSGLLLLSGCGGGGQGKPQATESAGLSACDPATAAPGKKISCHVGKEFTASCTFFVGDFPYESGETPTAQQYVLNDKDDTVDLMVPAAVTGAPDISYGCGDASRVSVMKAFKIDTGSTTSSSGGATTGGTTGTTAAGNPGDEAAPGAGASGGSGGTTTGTSGTAGAGDSTADSDHDGVVDSIDACPNTPSGAKVDTVGCSDAQKTPPPPATTAASIDDFEVNPATSATVPGTNVISWQISNAKAAYLWGNIFNRDASDANLPADQQCAKVSGRYLLTKGDGQNWSGNEPNFTDPSKNVAKFSTGILCNNSNSDTKDDCQYKAPGSAWLSDPAPLPSWDKAMFGDRLQQKSLYFYKAMKMAPNYQYQMVNPALSQIIDVTPQEANPECRIDLVNNGGQVVTSDTVSTRSLVQHGVVCLAAQGTDDQWQVKCKDVDAPKADISSASVSVSPDLPVVHFDLSGSGLSITGCDGTPSTTSNELIVDCKINADTMSFDVTSQGVGSGNVSKHTYTVEFKDPKIDLFKVSGDLPPTDDFGSFDIAYKVSRPYVIKDGSKVISAKDATCPWVTKITFKGQYVVNGGHVVDWDRDVKTPGDAGGTVKAYRDYDHYIWNLKMGNINSDIIAAEIPMTFWPTTTSGDGSGGIYTVDGDCAHTSSVHLYEVFNWTGDNVKSLDVSGATIVAGNSSLPKDQKGTQNGYVKVDQDMGPMDTDSSYSKSMDFNFVITYQDGHTGTLHQTVTNYNCNVN